MDAVVGSHAAAARSPPHSAYARKLCAPSNSVSASASVSASWRASHSHLHKHAAAPLKLESGNEPAATESASPSSSSRLRMCSASSTARTSEYSRHGRRLAPARASTTFCIWPLSATPAGLASPNGASTSRAACANASIHSFGSCSIAPDRPESPRVVPRAYARSEAPSAVPSGARSTAFSAVVPTSTLSTHSRTSRELADETRVADARRKARVPARPPTGGRGRGRARRGARHATGATHDDIGVRGECPAPPVRGARDREWFAKGKSAAILSTCRKLGPLTTDDRHPRLPTKPIRGFKRVCEFSASSVEILSRTRAACASTFSSRSQSFRLLSRERSF